MQKIGLFGTCGDSQWRKPFIERYGREGIPFYNPQLPPGTWKREDAILEAEHLEKDVIVLFPVTRETYASGSLSEMGFSILQAIQNDANRSVVVMVEQELDASLDNEVARKESLAARALVLQHLRRLRLSNLYIVETLGEMLEVSIQLYRAAEILHSLRGFNPHYA